MGWGGVREVKRLSTIGSPARETDLPRQNQFLQFAGRESSRNCARVPTIELYYTVIRLCFYWRREESPGGNGTNIFVFALKVVGMFRGGGGVKRSSTPVRFSER